METKTPEVQVEAAVRTRLTKYLVGVCIHVGVFFKNH